MIHELELEDFAGFQESSCEAQIGFARARVTRGVVVLCGARCYVQRPGKAPVDEAFYPGWLSAFAAHNYRIDYSAQSQDSMADNDVDLNNISARSAATWIGIRRSESNRHASGILDESEPACYCHRGLICL
jgi:hypothetical protein